MPQDEREVIGAGIKRLEELLRKRRGKPGFTDNVRYLEEQMAELQRDLQNAKVADA